MNTPKQKPDPQEFGREVIWHLCGLRSQLAILMQMFSRQIEPDTKKADAIYEEWINSALKIQKKFCDEALERIGIPPSKEQD